MKATPARVACCAALVIAAACDGPDDCNLSECVGACALGGSSGGFCGNDGCVCTGDAGTDGSAEVPADAVADAGTDADAEIGRAHV